MADVHADPAAADPDVAPNHTDVRDTFSPLAIALCWGLGGAAVVLGIIFGLVMANN
ncbi:hypothetical protein J0H33_16960 [bacterium]|nr:hypothetical protein [bacterium]